MVVLIDMSRWRIPAFSEDSCPKNKVSNALDVHDELLTFDSSSQSVDESHRRRCIVNGLAGIPGDDKSMDSIVNRRP